MSIKLPLLFLGIMFFSIKSLGAQNKIGYINFEELVSSMPESKKADSALTDYQQALEKNYQDIQSEFQQENKLLNSNDSTKYSQSQLEIKRQDLQNLYQKLVNYQNVATGQYNDKHKALYDPIEKKAMEAVNDVARENGYRYVFRENIMNEEFGPKQVIVYSSGDNLLLLVKHKLGIR